MIHNVQIHTELRAIANLLQKSQRIAICGHVSPDGDCIGSQLALQLLLEKQGKTVRNLLVKNEAIDVALSFLPGSDSLVAAELVEESFDTFVALDVPTRERLGNAACAVMDACENTVVIDHHESVNPLGKLHCICPDAPSTTMLVWQLAQLMDDCIGADIATCCFTGLVTDTGRFQFQNTTQEAFIAASEMVSRGANPALISREIFQNRSCASLLLEKRVIDRMCFNDDKTCVVSWLTQDDFLSCHAVKADAEPLINVIRSIRGVRVACLLREQDGSIRGGLRAKDNTDVAQIARQFGGGGHKAAAGFTLYTTVEEARETVLATLIRAVSEYVDE